MEGDWIYNKCSDLTHHQEVPVYPMISVFFCFETFELKFKKKDSNQWFTREVIEAKRAEGPRRETSNIFCNTLLDYNYTIDRLKCCPPRVTNTVTHLDMYTLGSRT